MKITEQYFEYKQEWGMKKILFRNDKEDISILVSYWLKEGCEGILNISEYHGDESLPSIKKEYTVSFYVDLSDIYKWRCQVNYSDSYNAKTFYFGNKKRRYFAPKTVAINLIKRLYK